MWLDKALVVPSAVTHDSVRPAVDSVPGTESSSGQYFHHVRREILPLLPQTATRIVDIGAGAGTTAAWLREYYPGARTIALEGNPAVEQELRANVDEAHIVNLNEALPDIGTPDLILFLDVLEHLSDPWSVLARLTSRIADHATVIVSVPNIAHLSVSVPLILRSRFVYQPAGILDRTHLRFFDRSSAVALLNSAGLCVEKGLRLGLGGPKTRMLDIVTLGGMRDQLTKQFVLAGRRLQAGQTQGRVHWLRGP